jgi:hypothetical protein
MREEVAEFIRRNHSMSGRKYRRLIDLEELFAWKEQKSLKRKIKIYDEEGANAFQFIKSYIQNVAELFPNIVLNRKEYDTVLPRHWDLSEVHYDNIQKNIEEYYKEFGAFYGNRSLEIILTAVRERCGPIIQLTDITPYFPTGGMFDKRMSKLLMEYYFFLVLKQYIVLSEDNQLFFEYSVREDITVNDIFTENAREDERNRRAASALDTEKDLTMEGNKKQLRTQVANLLFVFLERMREDKKTIDKTFENVMDKVYKIKEREKFMVTDRLKRMSDEERNVDTIKKMNKLGVWNKGLQKGLKKYVKSNYDDERAYIENLHQIEKNVRKEAGVEEGNIDMLIDDYLESMDSAQQIEDEVYDISDMNEDYTDGMYDPDDIGNIDAEE